MFKEIHFNSFKEFYEQQLSYSCDFYHSRNKYIYRGTYGDFKLLPKALRDDDAKKRTYKEQQDYEIEYLKKFLVYSNDSGLKVPSSAMNQSGKLKNIDREIWLPNEYEELAALAQHYGLPTRLLDWSFDILVSMYFASTNAIKAKNDGKEILYEDNKKIRNDLIIWACSLDIKKHKSIKGNLENPLSFAVPSYNINPNLNAQKGVLTAWKRKAVDPNEIIEIKSLEILLSEHYSIIDDIILYKFVLPFESCFDVFDYVDKHNYNAARLFPGYGGVGKYIDEKEMCDKLSSSKQFTIYL